MASSPELLRVEGVTKDFPGTGEESGAVLGPVSFAAGPGESLAILGPSGCGKTTLLLILAGLVRATRGRVLLEGEEVARPLPGMALVLQEYGLFPWKTVAENVLLGARIRKREVDPENLRLLTAELGLEGLDRLWPHQLSGGQRQRVALARALLLRPRLLLLDEPFAALDAMTRERLQASLLLLRREHGFGFVIVTHNIEEALFLGSRVLVMAGRPATVRHVVENPGAGDPSYRETEEFFSATVAVRRLIEAAA